MVELGLLMAKFKKENKELLTYLLYEAADEKSFIEAVKEEVDEQFLEINTTSYYFIKKSARKVLRSLKKYIRFSKKKETAVELLIYFCQKMTQIEPSFEKNTTLMNIYDRQMVITRKNIEALHPDLQHDYEMEMEGLR